MDLDLDTWVISDTHFGHENIIRFCGRPLDHEDIMVSNWLARVALDDNVLHLGDLTYRGDRGENQQILNLLPGNKHFVWGNHDKQRESYYAEAGFKQVGKHLGTFIESGNTREGTYYENNIDFWGVYGQFASKRVLFSHYPDIWYLDWDVNVHGHIHNNPYYTRTAALMEDHPKKRWVNVSVEVIDYAPVRLRDLL